MTIQDVARHLDVGWDIIKDIQKRICPAVSPSPSSSTSEIAIDEVAVGKGHTT